MMQQRAGAANESRQKRDPEVVAFLDIDYDEGKPETFRGVTATYYDENHTLIEKRTFSGWDAASLHAHDHADKVFSLSSVDHYIADVRRGTQTA